MAPERRSKARVRGSRLLIDWCVIAALATLIVLALGLSSTTEHADNLLYDRLISRRAPPPSDKIIIIAIDNRSLSAIGKWPWPRSVHAHLLDQLAKAQPKAVAYDVLFTEPSSDDAELAKAIERARPVYLPARFEEAGNGDHDLRGIPPVEPLAAAASGIGHVNVHFDNDGLVRRADLDFITQQKHWPHLMTLMADDETKDTAPRPILFQRRTDAFRTASFIDVLNGETPAAFLKDKLVLIGAMGEGMDQFAAPLRGGGSMAGVDLQANLLNTLLSGSTVTIAPRWVVTLISLIPLWVLLIGFWRWRPKTVLSVSALLIIGSAAGAALLFVTTGYWMPPTPAVIGLIFAYPLWGWRRLVALSTTMEDEVRQFRINEPATDMRAKPLPRGDRISSQVDEIKSAMQQSRDIRQGAQEREEALQMLSHDMRAPQASIITLLESEAQGVAPALTARLTNYARRTLALADNFVQLSRVNETKFAPEELNLCDIANEAIDELYPLSSARKIKIIKQRLDEPHYIMGEAGLLIRIVLNLLDNAIKYSAEGGSITCAVAKDGDDVLCSIADCGTGMSSDQVAALFQKFSPIGGKRNVGSSGSGLGLALVKSAAKRHGGSVSCSSTVGEGTTFTLRFPAAEAV